MAKEDGEQVGERQFLMESQGGGCPMLVNGLGLTGSRSLFMRSCPSNETEGEAVYL